MKSTVIFHVPHDGNRFPAELMRAVCVPQSEFLRYHREMRDVGVTQFVPRLQNSKTIAFSVSRLLCDVERFLGAEERMAQFGMGFCYERVYDGTVIKHSSARLQEDTLRYYQAHHARLDATVTDTAGKVLFFDLHSFTDKFVLPGILEKSEPFPDICIGYDEFLNAPMLRQCVKKFEDAGFSVSLNYPYAGSLVPSAVLNGNASAVVSSVMIEVNKAYYLRENGIMKTEAVRKIRNTIGKIAEAIR